MQRIRRASLILLMLCSMCAVFAMSAITASAASSNRAASSSGPTCDKYGDCCSGEYCCWTQGETPPSCSTASEQPTPVTQPQPGEQTGKIDGEKAAKAGKIRQCPGVEGSPYCNGWYQGYDKIAKGKGQGQGGISRNGIFTGVAIIAAILAAIAAIASSTVAAAGQSGWFPLKGILIGVAAVATIVAIGAVVATLFPEIATAIFTLFAAA